jgi:hypothetical protein
VPVKTDGFERYVLDIIHVYRAYISRSYWQPCVGRLVTIPKLPSISQGDLMDERGELMVLLGMYGMRLLSIRRAAGRKIF